MTTTTVTTVHNHDEIDFARPGKQMYEVAFHYDGAWGNAIVPLTVINGTARPGVCPVHLVPPGLQPGPVRRDENRRQSI